MCASFQRKAFVDTASIIGAAAGILTAGASLPQVIKAYRTGETGDISMRTQLALLAGLVLWIVYGTARQDIPLIVFNSIGLCLTSTLVYLKWRGKQK